MSALITVITLPNPQLQVEDTNFRSSDSGSLDCWDFLHRPLFWTEHNLSKKKSPVPRLKKTGELPTKLSYSQCTAYVAPSVWPSRVGTSSSQDGSTSIFRNALFYLEY